MEYVSIPIDETTIGNSFSGTLPLPELDETLEYVGDVTEVDVSVLLRDIQSVTISFSTEDIRLIGIPEGMNAKLQFLPDENDLIPETVSITVRGYREAITDLRREQLALLDITVDFSEFAASETGVQLGQKYASLDVGIAFLNSQGVFTTDKVKVSAEIIEAAEDANAG